MLDVCLLGTGGTVPLPNRALTACLLNYKGKQVLIDCGEGTQVALHKEGISCKHIDTILLTHYHADHTAGLPGLLLSMAKSDRTEPVEIIGPKNLKEIIQGVLLLARYIPFEIRYRELTEKEEVLDIAGLKITAFAFKHKVPCYGYSIYAERLPVFDREKAQRNPVPLKCWNILQKGESVELDGILYTPDMVLGKERKGLKVVYCTDTRPVPLLEKYVQDADLYIGEGMYGDEEKLEKARLNYHSMMSETATLASNGNVKELWLTHYSPSMPYPEEYAEKIKAIFPAAVICKDGQRRDMKYPEE